MLDCKELVLIDRTIFTSHEIDFVLFCLTLDIQYEVQQTPPGRVSVDMSTAMCRSTYRPMYEPRYWPSDGRDIDRLSANIADIYRYGSRHSVYTLHIDCWRTILVNLKNF